MHIYYAVTCYRTNAIMAALKSIGCPDSIIRMSKENLSSCKLDTGLTYSNTDRRETVMVIGIASSSAEFLNSFEHEKKHLEAHIANAYNIPPYGEEIAYLAGDIAQMLAKDIQMFICNCDCCKKQLNRRMVQ